MRTPRVLLGCAGLAGGLVLWAGPALAQQPPPARGTARGQLIVDGKPIALKYAVAVSGPDTFEKTKEAFTVLLTPAPVTPEALAALGGPGDARDPVKEGLALKYGVGGGFHMTVRHPALKGELQSSGGFPKKLDARGPDHVAGTITSWPDGKVEDIGGHQVQFTIAFDAPVQRRFAVEQPLVLGAGAKKLPAGGGEPGTAWLAKKCPALPANLKDPKVLEKWLGDQGKLPSEKDLAEMSKEKGHKVALEEALAEAAKMVDAMSALAPKGCKVLGGSSDGTLAVLQVQAEVFGSLSQAQAYMVKDGAQWAFKKQDAWKGVK